PVPGGHCDREDGFERACRGEALSALPQARFQAGQFLLFVLDPPPVVADTGLKSFDLFGQTDLGPLPGVDLGDQAALALGQRLLALKTSMKPFLDAPVAGRNLVLLLLQLPAPQLDFGSGTEAFSADSRTLLL